MGGGVANGSGGWWQWCCAIKYHTIKSKAGGERVEKKKVSQYVPSIKKNSKFKRVVFDPRIRGEVKGRNRKNKA